MSVFRRRTGTVAAQLALMLALPPALPALGHGIPKDSGNSWKSGNYRSVGRQLNSGNFANTNGSVNSGNTIAGSSNNANGPQCVVVRRAVVKGGC
ncbi:hypothetical protein ACFPOI_53795 [Nonomuraea angiospora]|uniref:Uncharacterized protein n=1 Tax=Nonomuraea angiospora TaxID=46172 RepID=A0ABR9M6E4_9ACTN|nr:hypothetical protein [Nonomuraea angiospora]MBE1588481.1 hypothetical protein [Nonomuraea angiospora]